MSTRFAQEASLRDIRLAFRRNTHSLISLSRTRTTYTSTSTSSSSSLGTLFSIGFVAGDFLYMLGERLLDGYTEIAIRARLLYIRRALSHKGVTEFMNPNEARNVRHMSRDVLELCSDYYTTGVRRKALRLIYLLLQRLDAWAMILLESNFILVLSRCGIEKCEDDVMNEVYEQIIHLNSAYERLSCKCATCLRAFRAELSNSSCSFSDEDHDSDTSSLCCLMKRL
ncbi:hypothetical protein ABKN59_000796 [Abortiporus biennis]